LYLDKTYLGFFMIGLSSGDLLMSELLGVS
jgi:hypothetical protein